MIDQKRSYLFAILTILFWSTSATAFKLTLNYLNYELLLIFSSFFSFLILFIYNLFSIKEKKMFINIKQSGLKNSLLLGFLNPFFYYLILFKAYSLIPAQLAQPINFCWPIALVLLSIPLLGQKISLKSVLYLLISLTGVIFISMKGSLFSFTFNDLPGIILAFFSTFIWAFYWILNLKQKKYQQSIILMNNFLCGTIYCLIFLLIKYFIFKYDNFPIISIKGVLGALYIGLFEMGLAFLAWNKALSLSESTEKIASLIYLVPILSLSVVAIVLGETIYYTTIIGLLLIIAGIFLNHKNNRLKKIEIILDN